MVRVVCALIAEANHRRPDARQPPRAPTFVAEADLAMTVADFADMINPPLEKQHPFPIHKLKLYRAQNGDGSWPSYTSVRELRPDDVKNHSNFMEPAELLSDCLGEDFQAQSLADIHVLVLGSNRPPKPYYWPPTCAMAKVPPREQMAIVLKSASCSGALSGVLGDADPDSWTTGDCGTTKDLTPWHVLLPWLPSAFFVRLEVLMVWRVFRESLQTRLDDENGVDVRSDAYKATHGPENGLLGGANRLILWGTPGVGKGTLLTLMCLWLAVKHQRDVVLFRTVGSETHAMLLAGQSGRYYEWKNCNFGLWRHERMSESHRQFALLFRHVDNRGHMWICADKVTHTAYVSRYRHVELDLCTSFGEIATDCGAVYSIRECLVPFWTQSDLKSVGMMNGFDADECKRRYEVSGGSLGQFFWDTDEVKNYIDHFLIDPPCDDALQLRKPLDRFGVVTHMPTIPDRTAIADYVMDDRWRVVTSEYARQRIGGGELVWEIIQRRYSELAL